jgi:DNA replication and repair protein RecF
MNIKHLSLRDFRNAVESEIDFSSGVNVICGANAAGKTNILEAIFYFAAGKSFRNCKDKELIRFGCEKGQIGIKFATQNVDWDMTAVLNKSGRRAIRLGEGPALKMTEYIGRFRAVIFTPDHLSLVKGSPENRRRFLDLAICQSFPRYAPTLNEYNRVLAQKNALLKRGNVIDELLEVYNERLASLASVITVNRRKYVQRLEEEAEKFSQEHSAPIQNAIKLSFIIRTASMLAALLVAFLTGLFNPLTTAIPLLAFRPLLSVTESIKGKMKK